MNHREKSEILREAYLEVKGVKVREHSLSWDLWQSGGGVSCHSWLGHSAITEQLVWQWLINEELP